MMKYIGRLIVLLIILFLGCEALNFMDSHGMINSPPPLSPVPAVYTTLPPSCVQTDPDACAEARRVLAALTASSTPAEDAQYANIVRRFGTQEMAPGETPLHWCLRMRDRERAAGGDLLSCEVDNDTDLLAGR